MVFYYNMIAMTYNCVSVPVSKLPSSPAQDETRKQFFFVQFISWIVPQWLNINQPLPHLFHIVVRVGLLRNNAAAVSLSPTHVGFIFSLAWKTSEISGGIPPDTIFSSWLLNSTFCSLLEQPSPVPPPPVKVCNWILKKIRNICK